MYINHFHHTIFSMPEDPDFKIIVTRTKRDRDCAAASFMENSARVLGMEKHVLLIEVELSSPLEQKLARVSDGHPSVKVEEKKEDGTIAKEEVKHA